MIKPAFLFLIALAACSAGQPAPRTCDPQPTGAASQRPGVTGDSAILPNGRGLAPAGERLTIGQGPLHLALSPDGALLASAEFGVNLRGVSLIQLSGPMKYAQHLGEWSYEKDRSAGRNGGYLRGLAFTADGSTLYAANVGTDQVDVFVKQPDGSFGLSPARSFAAGSGWPADLALSADGSALFVTAALGRQLLKLDAKTGAPLLQLSTPGNFPHAMLLRGDRVYVANEGSDANRRNRVSVHAASDLSVLASYPVGKNPAALAISPDGTTLYVAASDDDWIDRIDLSSGTPLQPFTLTSDATLTYSPSALAISPDGRTLYVAAPLIDAVLVLDAKTGARRGAIPAGWRPSALSLADGGTTLYIANAKGDGTHPSVANADISSPPRGLLQRLSPIPTGAALDALTARVDSLNGRPATEYAAAAADCARIGPLPARRGQSADASLIKHVVMVLKENKTFDSVFGDFPGAEASRDHLLFGERYTPNQHELARQFCLADNFLLESEQSVEGHYWMAAQVTNDYFERVWAGPWGRGVSQTPLPPAGVAALDSPRNGFIWDAFARAHVAYQSWGEFVGISGDLAPHIDLKFVDEPSNYLARPDTEKLPEFLTAVQNGTLPPFSFVALQWDHTFGGARGYPAPDYMVADNDLATGRLVEAISNSPYWKDTLILITEDDPSGSSDHVDSHRSFALVISPYARRGRVSSVRGSMPSLAATWQRALNVSPSSTFDATAEPLWDCLTATADLTPYKAVPSNIAAHVNQKGDPGEAEARGLDFSGLDRAQLGPSLWKAMRGDAPMPAALGRDDDD